MYQNLRDIDSVAEVDVPDHAVKRVTRLSGCTEPSGLAIDESARRLFIGCSGNALLAIFDLDRRALTAEVSVGGGPDSVVFDPQLHRIYIAGKSGVLTVIKQDSADTYTVLDSIKLHYGAHTWVSTRRRIGSTWVMPVSWCHPVSGCLIRDGEVPARPDCRLHLDLLLEERSAMRSNGA